MIATVLYLKKSTGKRKLSQVSLDVLGAQIWSKSCRGGIGWRLSLRNKGGETPKGSAGSKGLNEHVAQIHIQRRRFLRCTVVASLRSRLPSSIDPVQSSYPRYISPDLSISFSSAVTSRKRGGPFST